MNVAVTANISKALTPNIISKATIVSIAKAKMGQKGRKNLDWLYDDLIFCMNGIAAINTPLRMAHFFAQIMVESNYFANLDESLNYGVKGLEATFSYFAKHPEEAKKLGRPTKIGKVPLDKQRQIADKAYANIGGNLGGDDGWNFRGRGLMQLTGRDNYQAFSQFTGLDLINNPDFVAVNSLLAVGSATWYWTTHDGNHFADKDEFAQVTFKVNGGFNGFDDRLKILDSAKVVLGIQEPVKDSQFGKDRDAIASAFKGRKKDHSKSFKLLFQ